MNLGAGHLLKNGKVRLHADLPGAGAAAACTIKQGPYLVRKVFRKIESMEAS
jgi:hypothetical protein